MAIVIFKLHLGEAGKELKKERSSHYIDEKH